MPKYGHRIEDRRFLLVKWDFVRYKFTSMETTFPLVLHFMRLKIGSVEYSC